MAVTSIHPIKTTLKKAIDYICNADKTADEIYVSTHLCSREHADKEFELTKKQFNSRTKTLAHHLIQSFVPGEVDFDEAHQVGLELCESVLGGKYEYVLATHIDKNHIHNHIIFNTVDVDEGKVYHSYYGSYMNIRNQSDRLCMEHNLSVLDSEVQADIEEITKRKFTNWYDWNTDKQGSNFKSKLQKYIDKTIDKSKDWDEFIEVMKKLGYEIKPGKYIAFKHKDNQRFTRAKTLGDDYTESELRKRIKTPLAQRTKDLDSIVDMRNNEKIQNSPAYKHWASKHNLKTASSSVLQMREFGFNSRKESGRAIHKLSFDRNEIKQNFDRLSQEQKDIKAISKHIQVCMENKAHYDGYKKNPTDKIFYMMNKSGIEAYEKSEEQVDFFIKKHPHLKVMIDSDMKDKSVFKKLNSQLDKLQIQREQLADEHKELGKEFKQLKQIEKNYDDYMNQGKSEPTSILKEIKKHKEAEQEHQKSRTKKLAQEER